MDVGGLQGLALARMEVPKLEDGPGVGVAALLASLSVVCCARIF